jgi:AcrR family transcriptional regulator
MKTASVKSPRRGGRPSSKVAAEIRDEILDAATRLFFEEGYGAVSVEAIAAAARISKRTFYHRFKDKPDVFKAVVKGVMVRIRPPETQGLLEGKDGADILYRLAPIILHAALTPEAIALYRIVLAEAGRFPELALMMNAEGSRNEAVQRIAALLENETREGRMKVRNPPFAAAQFLHMIVSIPQRRALGLGPPITAAEINAWARETVDLFLQGCQTR